MDPQKDIVYAHMDLTHHIHWTGLFFPWHRWYLHVFEDALRNRCGYRGALPYWDWMKDAANFYESAFFKESDPKSGLGSWGNTLTQFRILDSTLFASSSFWLLYPFLHMLHQKFNLFPQFEQVFPVPGLAYDYTHSANASFIKLMVESLIDGFVGDFKGFQTQMEGVEGPHINVHFIVSRDTGGSCPSDVPAGCISGPTFAANGL
ncbi:tyrosinase copper-binding domain-containing protein [Mycena leptocephala]|nr:tyrosinase copper-binding domain-containing protein [Mycena leptocephala]